MNEQLLGKNVEFFQALGHPTRLAIVELFRGASELAVGQISEQLQLEQTNASQHLAILRSKQILKCQKEGNRVLYSLRDRRLIHILDLIGEHSLRRLREMLEIISPLGDEESR
jgi:ArsR family transcriptional regulator